MSFQPGRNGFLVIGLGIGSRPRMGQKRRDLTLPELGKFVLPVAL
jgi:hypothetical protein